MPTIYVDMDGVVADFDTASEKILGHVYNSNGFSPEDWAILSQHPRIYRDLPLCGGASLLINTILSISVAHGYDVKFLTAIPRNNDMPWSFYDKVNWARLFFPEIPVWFGPYSVDKCQHTQPGDVLIDDRISNINEWNTAGGIGILHTGDVAETLKTLQTILGVD